jgi:hypothetical protein
MVQIVTKVGTFDVMDKNGNVVVCKNGKALATFTGINAWDKDAIIMAIESHGEELNKAAAKVGTGNITSENVIPTLNYICDMLSDTIEDNKTKGFVTSRLKQVINKLAA